MIVRESAEGTELHSIILKGFYSENFHTTSADPTKKEYSIGFRSAHWSNFCCLLLYRQARLSDGRAGFTYAMLQSIYNISFVLEDSRVGSETK